MNTFNIVDLPTDNFENALVCSFLNHVSNSFLVIDIQTRTFRWCHYLSILPIIDVSFSWLYVLESWHLTFVNLKSCCLFRKCHHCYWKRKPTRAVMSKIKINWAISEKKIFSNTEFSYLVIIKKSFRRWVSIIHWKYLFALLLFSTISFLLDILWKPKWKFKKSKRVFQQHFLCQ